MQRSIEASATSRVAYERARVVLLDDPEAVFDGIQTVDKRRAGRFRTELSVDLGAGASVHQEVMVQAGVPRSTPTGLVMPLTWQATGRARLLPVFDGELTVTETRQGTGLRISGTYTVPLGIFGRLGDDIAARRLARRSLSALARRLARRLESEVAGPNQPQFPATPALDGHPEIYVG